MNKKFVIGIDEVGRGPVAGPVYVCSAKMPVDFYDKFSDLDLRADFLKNFVQEKGIEIKKIPPLRDSKKLSHNYKNDWVKIFREMQKAELLEYKISSADNHQIDKHGIAKCIRQCAENCLLNIEARNEDSIKLDGSLRAPENFVNQETIIKGDDLIPIISVASIIAKVARDEFMTLQAGIFPLYAFESNVGYGTAEHMKAIKKYGICDLHRISFLKHI